MKQNRDEYLKEWRRQNKSHISEYRKKYYKEHKPNRVKTGHINADGVIVWDD